MQLPAYHMFFLNETDSSLSVLFVMLSDKYRLAVPFMVSMQSVSVDDMFIFSSSYETAGALDCARPVVAANANTSSTNRFFICYTWSIVC